MFSSAFSRVFLFLMLFIASTAGKSSPVLLWGAEIPSRPAMPAVKQQEFQAQISALLENYTVVAFLENDLTASDFRCKQLESKASCYTHLSRVSPRAYYVKVEEPLAALRSIAPANRGWNTVDATGQLQFEIACQLPGGVHLIGFNNSIADRSRLLQSHDATIATVSQGLSCPVVYLYMSSFGTQFNPPTTSADDTRLRRAASSSEAGKLYASAGFVIYFSKIVLKEGSKETALKINDISQQGDVNGPLKITIESDNNAVLFDVETVKGYAVIKSFHVAGVAYRAADVETPLKFAYYCGELWAKANGSNSFLVFSHVQFQLLSKPYAEGFKFGPAWHCVGFFTPAILSGILVLAMMLAITGCGVCWIMDIHTNDRFEDPAAEKFSAGRAR